VSAEKLNVQRPDIYSYHDYRDFLRDHFEFLRLSRGVSVRALCKSAGLSHGYFSLVLKRQRSFSRKSLAKILPHIGLIQSESEYLYQLTVLADSSSTEERNRVFQSLKRLNEYKTNHPKEFETYKYLESWLNVAIRELTLTTNFKNDATWIQKHLNFPARISEIEDSIKFLIEHDLVKEKGNKLMPTDRNLQCVGGVFQLSLKNFHNSMLQLNQQALDRISKKEREQIGYTMALPKDQMAEVRSILEEAKNKIKALEEKNKSRANDTVYHVNLSAFPIAGEDSNE
jgi:uncharacterized protein (TIGR02147 family)